MKSIHSLTFASVVAAGALTQASAAAAELDPTTGALHSVDPGALMIGFEYESELATLGLRYTKWQKSADGSSFTPAFIGTGSPDATALAAHTVTEFAAVEGTRALRFGATSTDGATGVMLPMKGVLAALGKHRIRVTVWGRAEGAAPYLAVAYGSSAVPVSEGFVSVTAIRTGRETSDGWAEFSTGVIDASVWDVPLAQLSVASDPSVTGGNFVIDALEIVPVDGDRAPASLCTAADVDTTCGGDGECHYGHCVPAWASWGPTPSKAHRTEIVERWIGLGKHVQGARNAMKNTDAMIAAEPTLTADTIGGRAFHAGLEALVNAWRNQHTSYGGPANQGLLQPLAYDSSSSTLGACIGFGEHDLLEAPGAAKTFGYIVYRAMASAKTGVLLKRGDAVTKIDGIDPLTWVRSIYLTYGYGVPADPSADLAWSATLVAWMISHRASTVEITRCDSDVTCDGVHKSTFTVDVATPMFNALKGTGTFGTLADFSFCQERYQDAVEKVTPPTPSGDDTVTGETHGGVLSIQFDGTYSLNDWSTTMIGLFPAANPPTKIIVDTRQGNGGYSRNSQALEELIRPASEHVGFLDLSAASWNGADLSVLFTDAKVCDTSTSSTPGYCQSFIGDYFNSYAQSPPVAPTAKVVFLIAADVSANDYLAALVQGRTDQIVMGPGNTSGSFGTISSIASMAWGWSGGSIQMTDGIWGPDFATITTNPFHSGTGVAPDRLIAETMRDALRDRDTMLDAAHAWLAAGGK